MMISDNLEKTKQIAFEVAKSLTPGDIVFLSGDMGVGKTTFVRDIGKYFNFEDVSSPSYTLVNVYKSCPPIIHIDLYRCENEEAVKTIDLDYYLAKTDHIIIIEWAQRAPWLSKICTKEITIQYDKGNRLFLF